MDNFKCFDCREPINDCICVDRDQNPAARLFHKCLKCGFRFIDCTCPERGERCNHPWPCGTAEPDYDYED